MSGRPPSDSGTTNSNVTNRLAVGGRLTAGSVDTRNATVSNLDVVGSVVADNLEVNTVVATTSVTTTDVACEDVTADNDVTAGGTVSGNVVQATTDVNCTDLNATNVNSTNVTATAVGTATVTATGDVTADSVSATNNVSADNLVASTQVITSQLTVLFGATDGYVLTSNMSGQATWQAPSGGGSSIAVPFTPTGATLTNYNCNILRNDAVVTAVVTFTIESGQSLNTTTPLFTITNAADRPPADVYTSFAEYQVGIGDFLTYGCHVDAATGELLSLQELTYVVTQYYTFSITWIRSG